MSKKKTIYTPKFKQLCHDAVRTYMEVMCLQRFKCGFIFSETPKASDSREGYDIMAEIDVDPRYLKATITVYPSVCEDWKNGIKDNKEVGDIFAHEVAHILTHPLYLLSITNFKTETETADTREQLTETIARMAVRIVQLRNKEI